METRVLQGCEGKSEIEGSRQGKADPYGRRRGLARLTISMKGGNSI